MTCLDNVIGITRTPCACLADSLPLNYTESESGLYIDELPEAPINLKAVKSISDCGKDLPFILTNARTQAIAEFRRELFKLMQERFKQRSVPYVGLVGSLAYSNVLPITDAYAGIVLDCKNFRGANITINKIHTAMDATAAFDVVVYRVSSGSDASTIVVTLPITSLAGGIKENILSAPLQLPLTDETGNYLQYYLVYNRVGFQPKNNLTSCGCGMKENDLFQFVTAKGVTGPNTSNLKYMPRANESMGLILDVDARCGNDDIICRAYQTNEFIKVAIEYSILRKAVEILNWAILQSDEVNRYTMTKREQMSFNAMRLAKKFTNDIQWIAENIDISENDCYICNDATDNYRMGGIRL